MNIPCSRLLRSLALCGAFLSAGLASAATAPWPQVPFQYFAKQFPLSRVLGDFATAFGLKLELSPRVEGQVKGDYSSNTPTQFLDTLSASYGLTWYYHDGVLYVDRASEKTSRTLRIGRGEVAPLKEALTNLGIFDSRFGWGEFADRGVVMLSGPPAYVKLVSSTVDELGMAPTSSEEMRVFPLKHARAEDRTFSYRDQQVNTPGIASILRSLIGAGSGSNSSRLGTTTQSTALRVAAPAPKLSDTGGSDSGANANAGVGSSTGDRGNATPPAGAAQAQQAPSSGNRRAVIEADQRLNAIIVRDAPERMAAYESLIRQLDVPTPLVEIEAIIVDVNTDKVDQLGINWAGKAGRVSGGFGDVSADPTSTTSTFAIGNSINKTSILSNTAGYFLAQVNALASRGEARILGRPSVLTVDNLVAVLDLSQTFYVRLTGERVADLVPISTGTLLKVTPRLIQEGDKRMVQLIVDIQDGTLQSKATVDSLPTVTQSNISTQAVILENDSLLIGGYTLDSDTNTTDKVPVLGDIPVVGGLFRNVQKEHTRRERLFMIRPRIVENPATAQLAASLRAPAAPDATVASANQVQAPSAAAAAAATFAADMSDPPATSAAAVAAAAISAPASAAGRANAP